MSDVRQSAGAQSKRGFALAADSTLYFAPMASVLIWSSKRFLLSPGIWLGCAFGFASVGWFGLWADYLGPTSRTVSVLALTCLAMLAYTLWIPYVLARRLSARRRIASLSGRLIAADAVIPADAAAASWLANVLCGCALAAASLLAPMLMRVDEWMAERIFWTPISLLVWDILVAALAWLPAALGLGPALAAGIAASTRRGGGGFGLYLGRLSFSGGLAMATAALLGEVVSPQVWLLVAAGVPIVSAIAGAAAVRPVMPPERMPPIPSSAPYGAGKLLAGIATWTFCLAGLCEALRRAVAFCGIVDSANGPAIWSVMAIGLGLGLMLGEKARPQRGSTRGGAGFAMLAATAASILLIVLLTFVSRWTSPRTYWSAGISYVAISATLGIVGLTCRTAWEQFAARRSPSPGSACEFATATLLAAAAGTALWAYWLVPRYNANVAMWAGVLGLLATGTAILVLADGNRPGSLRNVSATSAGLLLLSAALGPWSARNWADLDATRLDYSCGRYFQGVRNYAEDTLSLQLPGQAARDVPDLLATRATLLEVIGERAQAGTALLADYLPGTPTMKRWDFKYVLIDPDLVRNWSMAEGGPDPLVRVGWWTSIRCDLSRYDVISLHLPNLDRSTLQAMLPRAIVERIRTLLNPGGWLCLAGRLPQDKDDLLAAQRYLATRMQPAKTKQQTLLGEDPSSSTVVIVVLPSHATERPSKP